MSRRLCCGEYECVNCFLLAHGNAARHYRACRRFRRSGLDRGGAPVTRRTVRSGTFRSSREGDDKPRRL